MKVFVGVGNSALSVVTELGSISSPRFRSVVWYSLVINGGSLLQSVSVVFIIFCSFGVEMVVRSAVKCSRDGIR